MGNARVRSGQESICSCWTMVYVNDQGEDQVAKVLGGQNAEGLAWHVTKGFKLKLLGNNGRI